MKKIIMVLMLLSACVNNEYEDEKKTNTFIIKWDEDSWDPILTYTKDPRTKLCFSVVRHDRSLSVSNVPCSPEVEKLIESE